MIVYICVTYIHKIHAYAHSLSLSKGVYLADLVFTAARGLSLVAEYGGYSPTAACRLLTAVALLPVVHRL